MGVSKDQGVGSKISSFALAFEQRYLSISALCTHKNELWSLYCFIAEQVDCKLAEHLPNTPEAIEHQPDCEMFVVTNPGDDTSTNVPTQGE